MALPAKPLERLPRMGKAKRRLSVERAMRAGSVVVLLEKEELSLEIPRGPERDTIQELPPQGPDQPFDERMR